MAESNKLHIDKVMLIADLNPSIKDNHHIFLFDPHS